MTDWKLVGGVSLIGITMGWLGSRLIPVKDNPKTVPSIEKDDDLNWGGDPDGQLAKALAKARQDSKKPRKPLEIVRLDSETFEAEAKPKLTPTQLKYLNMMKSNYNGYAYVEVDNRGWKPYKTRPVQNLLDKKIISIPKDNNHRFYGDVENFKAYNVIINPIALKYKYTNPFDRYNFTDKFAEYMAKQQPQQTSQNSSSNEIEIKYYMVSHNEAKNQHKYYIAFEKGTDSYTAHGRLPGYGRETTIKVNKQPNAEKMREMVLKKMKTYRVEKKDQMPSEIKRKLETELNSSLSPPKSEPKEEVKEETVDERDYNPYERMLRKRMGKKAETFEATKRKGRKSEAVPFSKNGWWKEEDFNYAKPLGKINQFEKEKKGFPLLSKDMVSIISKIVDGKVLKEPNGTHIPNFRWDEEPITMTWKELDEMCKDKTFVAIGDSNYVCDAIQKSFRYLPKDTVLTVYTGNTYPLKATFEFDGEEWLLILAPSTISPMGAESFEAVVVNRGKQPKGALGKAVLNQRMIEQSKVMAILEELENKVRLGLVDEKQLMGDLKRRFGAESTPVTETDKYDEIASRFTLMELEIALVQSLNKKDMDAANQIMKVIQRKKFINEYQAENNEGR